MNWHKTRISLDILEREVHLHLLRDTKQIDQLGKRLQRDYQSQGPLAGLFLVDDRGISHLLFQGDVQNKTIVHEVFHLTHYLLEEAGQSWDSNNHEIYALTIEYLYDQVERFLKEIEEPKKSSLEIS